MLGDFQTASQADVQDFVLARAAGRKEKNTPARAQLTITFRRGSQAYVDVVRKLVHRPLEVIERTREEKTVLVALDVLQHAQLLDLHTMLPFAELRRAESKLLQPRLLPQVTGS